MMVWTVNEATATALLLFVICSTNGIHGTPAKKSGSYSGRKAPAESIWGKPPYGYRTDPTDKDHWIIDEDAAPVVKRIFDLAIDGKGAGTDCPYTGEG